MQRAVLASLMPAEMTDSALWAVRYPMFRTMKEKAEALIMKDNSIIATSRLVRPILHRKQLTPVKRGSPERGKMSEPMR